MTDLTFDIEPTFKALNAKCSHATMTSIERMHALWLSTRYVVRAGIIGDFVECGVWRGGSMMLAAMTLMEEGATDRRLWLYDTYEGMTDPGKQDVQAMSGLDAAGILATEQKTVDNPFWAMAPLEAVRQNMDETGYPEAMINYVVGRVEETIPAKMPDEIALLRLDTDWYESTKHELEHLWPKLKSGGVLIIDDYGYWRGAQQAVDEFFATLSHPPLLSRIDYTGRVAVKP